MLTQIFIICLVLKHIPYSFFGFRLKKKEFIFLLKGYTAIIPLSLLGLILNKIITDKMGLQYLPNPALELFFSLENNLYLVLLIIEIVVLAPLAEELFFRGFLYKLVRQRYGFLVSALFVSVLFSFIHRTPQGIIPLFILSVCICYVYEKIQDISAPIIFHSIHNLINLILLLMVKNLF
ncbi:MAG: CPBP family intramembrane metalloprotease [Candidatus Omnitrophica bacterium]|nr:CPBP family intramembrane metalloprotease [Candidatus Omnitrophota bacterium]MBD3269617.1 CPBP family intramembrane metalloprotease [Candidatus Omnitrophota bacterium]